MVIPIWYWFANSSGIELKGLISFPVILYSNAVYFFVPFRYSSFSSSVWIGLVYPIKMKCFHRPFNTNSIGYWFYSLFVILDLHIGWMVFLGKGFAFWCGWFYWNLVFSSLLIQFVVSVFVTSSLSCSLEEEQKAW